MIYPATVLTASVALVVFMLTYVAPPIVGVYTGMGKELPLPTAIKIGVGAFLQNNAVWLLMALVVVARVSWWRWVPRRFKDGLALRLPFFGGLLTLSAASRWARTLAMLHAGGVPLQRALKGAGRPRKYRLHGRNPERGDLGRDRAAGWPGACGKIWRMPPLIAQMAETGERSGALAGLMNSAAEFYEKEVDRRPSPTSSAGWSSAMILGLGLVVGLVVISILLPIINMSPR